MGADYAVRAGLTDRLATGSRFRAGHASRFISQTRHRKPG